MVVCCSRAFRYWSYTWSRAVASGAAEIFSEFAIIRSGRVAKCHMLPGAIIAYKIDAAQCQRNLQQIFKKGASAQPADYAAVSAVNVSELAALYAALIR